MWLTRLRRHWARHRYARHPFPEPALQKLLDMPWPAGKQPWNEASWLAVDLETTGLDPRTGYVISIGWVAIEGGSIQLNTARHLLIDSRNLVGDSATIHHIRDSDRSEGVDLPAALRMLARALNGRIALMHHSPLDTGFLRSALKEQFGFDWFHPTADTLELEKKRLFQREQNMPRHALRLNTCRERYGLPDSQAHNALEDALATAELFLAWANHYGSPGPKVRDCLTSRP
ncbi:DNA polymerase-3 subunit epsilon [Halospina denitrificans]|uniref:DNA polymerase-3 subunit epsilon n=1 Tax=Halospina denitrificans TaxID=332522 RepID=A0A4R7K0Y3_9GAMM|nr:exonuclease domain-containing protein [Halospina denitrificans]TDT44492.1 DNA polymerase-3 subunit epsilon [Halospina denitrificans]